jgi:hypothetical protein
VGSGVCLGWAVALAYNGLGGVGPSCILALADSSYIVDGW